MNLQTISTSESGEDERCDKIISSSGTAPGAFVGAQRSAVEDYDDLLALSQLGSDGCPNMGDF